MQNYSGPVPCGVPGDLRLDRYIAEYLRLFSRSQIKAKKLRAAVNGKEAKVSRLVKPGDFLELAWPDPEPEILLPEDIPLDIIYEDSRVVVVNKAQGMVVHPGAGNHSGTLANALLGRRLRQGRKAEETREHGPFLNRRLGIAHRLDKDTSGVIIAAYDDEALAFLSAQFKERQARKIYAAVVRGSPPEPRGKIDARIARDSRDRKRFAVSAGGGRSALTHYKVVRELGGYSLLLLKPRTGRTHQIRVHLKYLGCPILGDPVYGRGDARFPGATLMLHAKSLSVAVPGPLPETPPLRTFSAPLPPRFTAFLRGFR
ncbi:MAG: RluA family pseudouridine synthase [Treponema sp.]|jgi:23S rRNA pseudouridine1911/1915/1917 synthase|nr:RluA family pseudouridine synthase [Treponema sp.]